LWDEDSSVSSIWTPGGEYQPRDEPEGGPGTGDPGAGGPPDGYGGEPGTELDEEQVRQALAQLASTPVAAIVADHAIRLHELAVLHLGLSAERPESLGEAALAIDAMAALVDGLGDRLGEAARPLADALAQLRLAFVQVRNERGGQEDA
jgi:hypothetical protein